MKLLLRRIALRETYTIGRLYVNGAYVCDTVEDKVRDLNKNGKFDNGEVKVKSLTAIPYGTYRVAMGVQSPKFSNFAKYPYARKYNGQMPRLLNVSGFEGILIHCGTSAAIATGAASGAKKDDLSVAISISIIFTILMMVFEPMIIRWAGMSQLMGGALIGGTVDSTGAVVLAGNALGAEAEQAAVLVKSIQNILIGFIAFFVALFFATRVDRQGTGKVGASEIWVRFPKFIIGFFVASLVASFLIQPLCGSAEVGAINKVLDQYKNWAFVLAFTSIGLDTNFKDIASRMQGGKVLWLYVIGQLFNIALTLFAVWFLLSGVVFKVPVLDLFK